MSIRGNEKWLSPTAAKPVDLDTDPLEIANTERIRLEAHVRELVRLVRWLGLTFGTNVPIFHGVYKDEMRETYMDCLSDYWDDGDAMFAYIAELRTKLPDPEGPAGTPPGTGAYAAHEEAHDFGNR